ncbi:MULTISPECIES: copper-binding protein [Enterobacteriaceae]|uniref:Copper ABC transporter substrate-binding protein n=1 Tax=Kluyvera genomosp. 2 TaxID=2774054 RepID=A0A2T2Y1P5_9ENTR|nr:MULTISPECIES: copper-binding protein [Enterobacteriaceae]HAT3918735.1 copper ABC transporter substrate-binding protein [Kluyvera ascorbata]PSR46465.1 copper ABC transporter substrate-binding protein [Kluyvera genomosp. 2]BBQ82092.1 copper ABC transporter substrate-binding protein [Klebsiella sp. WP3-W18-ESBL-02]BBR19096.1 copper ABC transporter substrate-binding protein [Klebsiella sp. WP3-S18-ESBL-05]BBR57259.1 copper ABC transporter substrate-binding protein [Klebsiella sp. WP4-W18-ESBL-0
MRHFTTLLGGIFMVMTMNVQATEMQHDGHGSMTTMNAQPTVIQGTGIVKLIDRQAKKITIAHDAIAAIGWPAMTMRFTYAEPTAAIEQLKAGSQVDFSFIQQGNISLLQDIKTR